MKPLIVYKNIKNIPWKAKNIDVYYITKYQKLTKYVKYVLILNNIVQKKCYLLNLICNLYQT